MTTVYLLDDHEIVRRGLTELIDAEPDLSVVGQSSTYAHAAAQIPALAPDIAVLDAQLPDGNGIELCRTLLATCPGLRCLILSSFAEEESMLDAVLAGASGYIVKDITTLDLTRAIREVGEGRSLLDHRAAAALMKKLRHESRTERGPLSVLTGQERTLLALLGEGLTNKQIAERMCLAEKTIKNYVSRLLAKLGMERRTQAAVLAAKMTRPGGRRSGNDIDEGPGYRDL